MRVTHWAAVALAGVLLAQPALGQGGGAGGGVPQHDPNAPTESGAENLNKPTGERSKEGTGSSSEAEANEGTLHKAKSHRHKRAESKSKSKPSDESAPSSDVESGAQGK